MTDTDFYPLDPDEGPSVWARQSESNRHTYEIATGTDPENPTDTYRLSAREIQRLANLVRRTYDE